MPVLGTKQFWIPSPGSGATQQASQILKNGGYFSLQLLAVNYLPKGNFWQKHLGGSDTITLASNLKYVTGVSSIEASSVQDIRKVKVGNPANLGLQRNIAVKIPATIDAMDFSVVMTAVKNDTLQAKFDMLNNSEFQPALELLPQVVGQVFTITKLVKKLLTDSSDQGQLEASFAAIIGQEAIANPVDQGRLTAGYLILLDTTNGDDFTDVDVSKFGLRGTSLYYGGTIVSNTYVVINISFDKLKGANQGAGWYKKYTEGMSKLDGIQLASDLDEIKRIYDDARKSWLEGNALLDADETYLNSERMQVKAAALKDIKDKYEGYLSSYRSATDDDADALVADMSHIFQQAANSFDVDHALPATVQVIGKPGHISVHNGKSVSEALDSDVAAYHRDLKEANLSFELNSKSE